MNIFDSNCEALVNPVNCVGVMGKGLALQFKKRFPRTCDIYIRAAKEGRVVPGYVFITPVIEEDRIPGDGGLPRYIIHFPTKQHWAEKSRIEFIRDGLESLRKTIKLYNIESIAIPAIGCGLGGLNWSEVRREIQHRLNGIPGVTIIEPG